MKLNAGIGRRPGRVRNLVPEIVGLESLCRFSVDAAVEGPIGVVFDGFDERVRDTHRIVRVLARNGAISLRLPVGVEGAEFNLLESLLGELNDTLNIAFGDHRAAGVANGAFQIVVFFCGQGQPRRRHRDTPT